MSHVVSLREDTIERKLANRYIVIKLTIMVATIVVIIIVFTIIISVFFIPTFYNQELYEKLENLEITISSSGFIWPIPRIY